MVRKHRGAEVCVYRQGEPLSRVKLVGKKYQGALLYLEEPLPLFTTKLQPIVYTSLLSLLLLLLSLLLLLPFIHCPHAPSLSLAYSHLTNFTHTYTSHTALFLKGATQLLQQWQLVTHRQNLNPLLFRWSRRCGSILDFQWVMLTKKPQFASSAETRWQVILFKFPTDWTYNLLLHYVVSKFFKFDNVVWRIANKDQILYCIKV